jgi:hypothetical protein
MTDSPAPPTRRKPGRRKAAGVTFAPVPTARKRQDGWTPERQQRFLAALHACGIVAAAAKAVGMTGATAYRLRRRPGAESFAAAWDRLLREARGRALDLAMEQAMTESFVPRSYRGQFTGMVTADNQRMILAVLRAGRFAKPVSARAAPNAEPPDFPRDKVTNEAFLENFIYGSSTHPDLESGRPA